MDRIDIERILLDHPKAIKRFVANSGISRQATFDTGASSSTRRVRSAGATTFSAKATAEDIKATDLINIRRRGILSDIGRFVPELSHESPLKALAFLTDGFKKSPSEETQYLIQDAINRLTVVGELDKDTKNAVATAIDVLTTVKLPRQGNVQNKDSIFSNLYEHSDFKGRSFFAFLGPNTIYESVAKSYLDIVHLQDRISSLTLNASLGETRGDVILFQDDGFFGRFTGIRTNPAPTQQVSVSYVGDFINDRTSSLLLVRRFEKEQLRALGDPVSKAIISNIIGGIKKIKRLREDPIFTWDMWPTGGDSHPNDPDKRFVQIKIPVEIEVNNWFNYDAEIWLWFYFYISGGYLAGYLAYYGAEVEGGIISGSVLDGIMEELPNKFGDIETTLNSVLSTINGTGHLTGVIAGPFSSVYLLPGDQTQFSGSVMEGSVADNVTMVLTPRQPLVNAVEIASVGLV
jgi:hypothetical protein